MTTRMRNLSHITKERVRELFNYNPETGEVTRKEDIIMFRKGRQTVHPKGRKGMIINSTDCSGYYRVGIDGVNVQLHRVIWLWWYGSWPENLIDHIDRNVKNNAINNLREASHSCNMRNSKTSTRNKSGIKGVRFDHCTDKWIASILKPKDTNSESKTVELIYSSDITEAAAYRLAAEQCLNWSGCDSSSSAYQHIQKYIHRLT